jgi:pimeloyl-ACP methyl ester carboxylesterase
MEEVLPCGDRLPTWQLLLVVILFAASVSAPADLRAENAADPQVNGDRQPPAKLLVVLIGGIDSDPTPAQIDGTAERAKGNSGLYRFAGDLTRADVLPEYFNWNGTRAGEIDNPRPPKSPAIAAFIRDHLQARLWDRVALVGNSWGGHTALEVVRLLRRDEAPIAIDLAVFLDASSTGRATPPPKVLPENVNRIFHIRTRNLFVWGVLPPDRRLQSIDLGDPAAGFMQNGRPAYDATFDFHAHIAAEWDERVHDEIRKRLLELLPAD